MMESSGVRTLRKKYICFIVLFILVGVITTIGAYSYEQKSIQKKQRQNLGYSDEMILSQPYFDIVVASDENRHLPSDVVSYSFGDGYIHIVLPSVVSDRNVVAYIRDAEGNYLARRVYDFSDKVMIGQWEIVVDRPSLPTMFFESESEEEFYNMISSPSKEVVCYGNMQITIDGEMSKQQGLFSEYLSVESDLSTPLTASLQGRGMSSWDCDSKKSFTLRLEKDINLLGLGNNKSWNLIGSAYDPSLIKNITFNGLATRMGIKYQPQMQCINLYVDGKYQGVYILTTKVSVGDGRVELSKGDYLYKMDAPVCEQPLSYESVTWFEDGNTAPAADLIYPKDASDRRLEDAKEKLQRFIDAVENPDSDDFDSIVDVESLVRYYWIQEAGMNFDAWQRSVYIYYDAESEKMYLGPVWDMDLTLGSPYEKAGMRFDTPEGFRIMNAGWYTRLFAREEFLNAVVDAYVNGGVREELLNLTEEFYNSKKSLGSDAYLNYDIYGHANQGTTLDYGGGNYDEYCDNMIDFYRRRIDWIDEQMKSFM